MIEFGGAHLAQTRGRELSKAHVFAERHGDMATLALSAILGVTSLYTARENNFNWLDLPGKTDPSRNMNTQLVLVPDSVLGKC